MADLGCSFFSSLSFNTNYNLPLFLPPKRYYSSALHSHNSRIKRSSHHILLLFKPSPFAASASDIDVISTHEYSDGSFLFRFGDPCEIEKNVEMEESKTVEEEIEGEDKNGISVVKLNEGGDEAEVIASGLTEASDRADSVVSSSNTVVAVEGENEFSKKLLEDDTELPVLPSNEEIGGISTPDLGIERAANVEDINEEYKDSSPVGASIPDQSSKIENSIATVEVLSDVLLKETSNVTSSSKETEITSIPGVDKWQLTVNVEEYVDQEDSPADASILDQSSEVVDNFTTVALSGKESDDITSSDIDTDQSGKVEEGLNEDHEDSPGNASILDKSSEVVNGTSTVALLEKETDDIKSISDIKIEPTGNVEGGIHEEYEVSSADDTFVLDSRSDVLNIISTEASSEEETADITSTSDIEIEPTGNVEESKDEEYEYSPADMSVLDKRSEDLNIITAEASPEKETDGVASPSDIEIEPTGNLEEGINEEYEDSPVDTSVLDNKSEVLNIITTEASSEEETADIPSTFDIEIEPSGDVEESKDEECEETVGYASEIDTIQLMTVPPQLEADSMREEETGTETVKEPRDDDASENQTVGDDLVEASVHEVIAESTGSTITRQEMLITDFVLSSGAALLPHPSKVLTGGEDAYFIVGQTWLGLADGVSQWSLEGTTEGVYAQELIQNCEKLVNDCNGNSINNPIELLNLSVAQTHSPGSSTILIAQFDGQALHVANVGDSGFIVLRHGAVYKRSSPMHHVFSLPVHIERGDDPSCVAQLYRVDLEEDDLIVLATDGLLDNLYDQELSLIAMKSLADHKSPEEIAVLLAKRAQEVGSSASGRSPFADDAQAAGFPGYSGGKLDDVAVVVSVVQSRQ